ncbi:MAG: hypothetical protein MZV49_24440 [Rhodopseudomonas palustris]|nr:hypothetical protein [Rhodopseudomonas palustris]
MLMATGDMGFVQAKKYDLEVWAAGRRAPGWRSPPARTSGDYQARRMAIRYAARRRARSRSCVHTLNGSGLARRRGRVAAILENYQQPDGIVVVPEPLRGTLRHGRHLARAEGRSLSRSRRGPASRGVGGASGAVARRPRPRSPGSSPSSAEPRRDQPVEDTAGWPRESGRTWLGLPFAGRHRVRRRDRRTASAETTPASGRTPRAPGRPCAPPAAGPVRRPEAERKGPSGRRRALERDAIERRRQRGAASERGARHGPAEPPRRRHPGRPPTLSARSRRPRSADGISAGRTTACLAARPGGDAGPAADGISAGRTHRLRPPPRAAMPAGPIGPAPGVQFAGHGARLGAYILDAILVGFVDAWSLVLLVMVPLLGAVARVADGRGRGRRTSATRRPPLGAIGPASSCWAPS